MSFNDKVAEAFTQISQLLELLGEDQFRVNAHARAARAISAHPVDLSTIVNDAKALSAIPGVGAKTAAKITELATTGKIAELEELRARVPAGLLDLLGISGLGPKTAKALWDTLNVTSIDDLKRVIADGSILRVPRMGQKTVDNISKSLAVVERGGGRMRLGEAMPIALMLVEKMRSVRGVTRVEYAGSLRRGRDTIGDIDILATTSDDPSADRAREAFATLPEVEQVLAKGESKCSVRLELGSKTVQADLRLVPEASFGAAWLYFSGSKEHNVHLRERALKKKLTLNEYGLYPDDGEPRPQHRGIKAVASKTEEEIYRKLGVPFRPPELREDWWDIDAEPPGDLIELEDMRAELHAHTTASDGSLTIAELIAHAKKLGMHTLAVTDHSQSSVIANGLKPDRLRKHIDAVREAAADAKGIHVLVGSEVDILADGRLDYEDDLLAELDIVVASPHAALKQDPAKATARLLKAIEHPLVHIIGHPTGRLINEREGLEPDMRELCTAAASHGTALEINSNWLRLDLRDSHVKLAVELGCTIAINCDVHHPDDSANLPYGVMTGRRGGLTKDRCLNTWPAAKIKTWLDKKRNR